MKRKASGKRIGTNVFVLLIAIQLGKTGSLFRGDAQNVCDDNFVELRTLITFLVTLNCKMTAASAILCFIEMYLNHA